MIVTDDSELARMARIGRANGWDRNLSAMEQVDLRRKHDVGSELYAKYSFYDLAYNMRPTEITGFLGLTQLALLDENIIVRRRNFEYIRSIVATNGDFVPMQHEHIESLSPFALPFVCRDEEKFAAYAAEFSGAGIEIRPMIAGNMQRQPFYKK